ncbi:hypothetical protein LQT97_09910 [Brucella pseudogrignonensis]|uniref:hypothetical protein n=1 Tax=Brucella pseudogrignonensis TaxID=419475 RepID=UPI001E4ECBAA|nr:hypothetical protein [Brucella pseudogrignonensis]MCD4511553.1 hypothetical protein [Brucella pseudogrignonensis]
MMGLLDYLKIGAGVAVGFVLSAIYYNGVPILKDIPYVGLAFEGQAKKGLVPEFQVKALQAQLAEEERQRKAGQFVIDAYQVQLRNSRAAEAAQLEKTEREIVDYEKRLAEAGRACLLDSNDVEFLRQR